MFLKLPTAQFEPQVRVSKDCLPVASLLGAFPEVTPRYFGRDMRARLAMNLEGGSDAGPGGRSHSWYPLLGPRLLTLLCPEVVVVLQYLVQNNTF